MDNSITSRRTGESKKRKSIIKINDAQFQSYRKGKERGKEGGKGEK